MNNLYEIDYDQWLENQKELLLNRNFDSLDVENLIGELVDMGDSYLNALESHLEILLIHLLKYNYQKVELKDSWVEDFVAHTWLPSIDYHRKKISKIIKKKPSLKTKIEHSLENVYLEAKESAIKEMNRYTRSESQKLNDKSFPDNCPWSFEEIIEEDWLPEEKL